MCGRVTGMPLPTRKARLLKAAGLNFNRPRCHELRVRRSVLSLGVERYLGVACGPSQIDLEINLSWRRLQVLLRLRAT